ncbi:ribonuclease H-like domain-containing protein, partial [Tanacetum coccineum]
VAKASLDESTKWHRRMAHVNFKNINKLAENGLVKGLPSKIFSNEHNYVACNKGKQHKASYKAITAIYDRHQVTPLTSNLNAVKKIFKYLKGHPKLGLWYPRDSPFMLEAYSDSDYAGAHGDRKSTTRGCCSNKDWLVQGGTALGKDIIKSVDGCDDLPKIIRECGASESAGVYVSSLHSQHHAHMCFCCFLMLVKCFAAVPSQVSILKAKIYLET